MRNILQLLGGVAVAGVVAAGSTAFTGAGLTKTLDSNVFNGFIGGSVSHTVTGAVLTRLTFTQAVPTTPGVNKVTGASLIFDSATPVGATVTVTSDGTIASSTTVSATGFHCQVVQANFTSLCVVGTAYGSPVATDWYTGTTAVTVGVTA